MVFRLEESIAAVCAPSPGPDADLRVCQAVFESRRYLVYAAESLLVVLVEAPAVSSSSARDQAKSASRFELWQVWNAQDPIRCVRFNSSKKVARGALALCIDEGRGVLLMPASATSSRAAAMAEASRASTLGDAGSFASASAQMGRVALEKTFAVHLTYGVLSNGDFCIFRVESIPFSGVSPRLSLLLSFSDLREQLADAHVYSVSSSDYQDQESESASFFVEEDEGVQVATAFKAAMFQQYVTV
ncbi:hypothetical protein KRP22_010368 [Phytophthora ramorum]|nr:hypothetical protein KRP22_5762 [Phytophthora ramorum]